MNLLDERYEAYFAKLAKLKEIIKLDPMKIKKHMAVIVPKVGNMERTAKVVHHKVTAMSGIVMKSKKPELSNLERHVDRALMATELLNGIMDDTLDLLS